jgi:F0F1-type ATP synthase assembly protein I
MRPRLNARGLLFVGLTAGLAVIAAFAVGGGAWIVAVAAGVLALWMAELAAHDLGLLRRRRGRRNSGG